MGTKCEVVIEIDPIMYVCMSMGVVLSQILEITLQSPTVCIHDTYMQFHFNVYYVVRI